MHFTNSIAIVMVIGQRGIRVKETRTALHIAAIDCQLTFLGQAMDIGVSHRGTAFRTHQTLWIKVSVRLSKSVVVGLDSTLNARFDRAQKNGIGLS
jgi:hypothetical protein